MKEYTQVIAGIEHTVLLDDEDAERLGDAVTPATKSTTATGNKARQAEKK